jgi:hypothetical protein
MSQYAFRTVHDKKIHAWTANDLDQLFVKVANGLEALNIKFDPESIRESIKRQNFAADVPKVQPKSGFSLAEAFKAANALVNMVRDKVVTDEELTRRANICSTCPHANTASDCMSCGGAALAGEFVQKIKAMKGKDLKIPDALKKKNCEICKCYLSLLLVTKFEDLKPEDPHTNARRPMWCWLKTDSPNFTQQ